MAYTRFDATWGVVLKIPANWTVFLFRGIAYAHHDGVIRRVPIQAKAS